MHITTAEAQEQGLIGADRWKEWSILRYRNEETRDRGVAELYREAITILLDTITLKNRAAILEEYEIWMMFFESIHAGTAGNSKSPICPKIRDRRFQLNIENFKIAAGFEIFIKARLFQEGYVPHEIEKATVGCEALAKQQKSRPITVQELLAASPSRFDGTANYWPALSSRSLQFSTLTEKPLYGAAIGLSAQQIQIIDEYRKQRNEIHLPGEIAGIGLRIKNLPDKIAFLVKFINDEIIFRFNEINTRHEIGYEAFELLA